MQDLYAFQEKRMKLENNEQPADEGNGTDEEEPQPEHEVKPIEASDSTTKLNERNPNNVKSIESSQPGNTLEATIEKANHEKKAE